MKNKIIPLLFVTSTLLIGGFSAIAALNPNQNHSDLIESTIDEQNEKDNVKRVDLKYVINEEQEAEYSKIFVQYAYNEADGAHYLRYATAVRGNISSVSYIRKSVDGEIPEKEFECHSVYYGISANGSTYYYDGTAPSLTEGAGEYYWATYTVRFSSESVNIAKMLDVSLSINGEVVEKRDDVSAFNQITSKYENVEETFNVMSFNIRTETTSDTGNKSWDTRKSHLMNWVLQEEADRPTTLHIG